MTAFPKPAPREKTRFGQGRKSQDPRPPRDKRAKAAIADAPAPLAFPKPIKAEKAPKSKQYKPPRRLADPNLSDPQFLAFIHDEQECVGRRLFPGHVCKRGTHASHFRRNTGMALKESDRKAINMCGDLHLVQWERYAGVFKGWTREERHVWFQERIVETQVAFLLAYPDRAADFPELPAAAGAAA